MYSKSLIYVIFLVSSMVFGLLKKKTPYYILQSYYEENYKIQNDLSYFHSLFYFFNNFFLKLIISSSVYVELLNILSNFAQNFNFLIISLVS